MSRATAASAAALVCCALAGCGGSSSSSSRTRAAAPPPKTATAQPAVAKLRFTRRFSVPSARSGGAAAASGSSVVFTGGLDGTGISTSTVFELDSSGAVHTGAPLPGPVHDAAAAAVGNRLLLFGGGEFEGSNRIIQLEPGPPRTIGTLPQALSDLVAVTVGSRGYVVGGWNGTVTNADVYAIAPSGNVSIAARLPLGVRYPAAAALAGRVIVAGGETTSGAPTRRVWSFDPASQAVAPLPDLPAPIDHGAGEALGGRFYLLGGLRRGVFSDGILSWAPGESRWRAAGHLPEPLSDLSAAPLDGGIAVIGGRNSGGAVADVTILSPS